MVNSKHYVYDVFIKNGDFIVVFMGILVLGDSISTYFL